MAMRDRAVGFVVGVLRRANDWQIGEHALASNERLAAWMDSETGGDSSEWHTLAQSIIREAEAIIGDDLRY